MTITLPEKLAYALSVYADKRGSDPAELALSYISERVPSPVEMLTCCACGKQFPGYAHKNKFYCSYDCYQSVPFPRLGITIGDLRHYYGESISAAASGLGVSVVQLRRTVKRFGISDRFLSRRGG